jgi:hypothetical protein
MPTLSLFNTIAMAGNHLRGIAGGYKAIETVDGEDTGLELNFRYHQSGDKYRASITAEGITKDFYIYPMPSEMLPSSSEYASPLTIGGTYDTGRKRKEKKGGKVDARKKKKGGKVVARKKAAVVKTFRITCELPAKSEGSGDSSGDEEEEEEE